MPVPQSFKAAVAHQPKAQDVVSERSLGDLESGEVGIKITATAVNPVDWKMRDYDALISDYPAVLGSDAARVIASIRPDISGFAVSDRVFLQGIIGKYESSTFQYLPHTSYLVEHVYQHLTFITWSCPRASRR
jgi:NADPH:quinone reductase-like Zn-dependent oxidoreductase